MYIDFAKDVRMPVDFVPAKSTKTEKQIYQRDEDSFENSAKPLVGCFWFFRNS